MAPFGDRLRHAWNAFRKPEIRIDYSYGRYSRSPVNRTYINSELSVLAAVKTRIAMDAASVKIHHVKMNGKGQTDEIISDGLHSCLNVEANIDQSGQALRLDIFQTLLNKGVCAIVPVDTTLNPSVSASYEIKTMRVGEVIEWFPEYVRVKLFNQERGELDEVILPKKTVAIVESPLYPILNAPNSTFQRLSHKLALLDSADDAAAANKLDLIFQLPYTVRSEARKQQAKQRLSEITDQLTGSKYGIAYADATEKITQLNRPVENTLLSQIEYLTKRLHAELGVTEEVLAGTANESTMMNYRQRTIKPLVEAVVEELRRKFFTATARGLGHELTTFTEPFSLVPVSELAELGDKLIRNQVVTPNEFRSVLGLPPANDPDADKLRNPNLPVEDTAPTQDAV